MIDDKTFQTVTDDTLVELIDGATQCLEFVVARTAGEAGI